MAKKLLLYLNISLGITLAIQALFHPTMDQNSRLIYIIIALLLANSAVISNVAYSAALSETTFTFVSKKYRQLPRHEANQRWKALLNVVTTSLQATVFLALLAFNILFFLEITQTSHMIWILLVAAVIPLAVAFLYNLRLTHGSQSETP